MKGDQLLIEGLLRSGIRQCACSCPSCVLLFPWFSLILDRRGRGKVGSACEEFEDNEGGILGYCF